MRFREGEGRGGGGEEGKGKGECSQGARWVDKLKAEPRDLYL